MTGCWAMLMKSKLFHTLPDDILAMGNELRLMYQREAEVQSLELERDKLNGSELMDINLDIEGKREEIESRRSAFYGLLAKASRNLEETIEDDLKTSFASFKEKYIEITMRSVKRAL